MNALTGASGVGSETWKRTCAGITPSRLSLAKIANDEIAASAKPRLSSTMSSARSPSRSRSLGSVR